ncbi:pyrroloquinoline quinone biosynthesis protein PqqB [Phyllobacterium lublinensis]|uniref:pyrroloquinoline quinone biosynthesis protein PqqB n=1 Tax=Phyllobacterium lublinensis TaxID=2875708 RepID=UPI001CCA31B7|nr:pyrroloquinoline quinone biosynthesis protein PqqB [Phyllobacterium sp. 2063]MBZ9655584.1 pyrroloquinoline quinone biosynthesis protein PqqB [Phyllobacterium sp. 2063]
MRLKIIGSAAGGGFPQWNCNYRLSRGAWEGATNVRPRTQSSLGVSANGSDWVLFNASPDIRQQIAATPELQPRAEGRLRSTPIRAVILTNADVDHIAGLLSLREREPFVVYATRRVLKVLEANSIFNVLDPSIVQRRELALGQRTDILDVENHPVGITIETFPVSGKVALFLEDQTKAADGFGTQEGDTIGLRISSAEDDRAAYYIPGCAGIDDALKQRLGDASYLLFDGTVFTDDEMITAGVGTKTGTRMGHLHIAGDGGSMAALADIGIKRKIYVHINNTNPILDETSRERAAVEEAGWEVAFDGMEVRL